MRYNILALADIHWGAMDAHEMADNLQLVLDFIEEYTKDHSLDMVVICGDYFDYRLTLNSKPAIFALKWFDELFYTCKKCGVKKLRAVKGTKEHDNDQWDAIRPKDSGEDEDAFFRKFLVTGAEETLPGLNCVYCPDETINVKDHELQYTTICTSTYDIGFFHGNFDAILPKFVIEQNLDQQIPSIIYYKDVWQRRINGPMISGHWHVFKDMDPLFYIGSFDRWKFGEEEPKGALFISYDTDDHSYYIKRLINPFARNFVELQVDNSLCNTPEHFSYLQDQIASIIEQDKRVQIKVKYQISKNDPESVQNFDVFKNSVLGKIPRGVKYGVKFSVKDLIKREKKMKRREEMSVDSSRYDYILKSPMSVRSNILTYLKRESNYDMDPQQLEEIIGKYLAPEYD